VTSFSSFRRFERAPHLSRRAVIAGLVVVLLAVASAVHSGPHVWRGLTSDYRTYRSYDRSRDAHAFLAPLALDARAYDFFAAHLERGDCYFFQVPLAFTQADADRLGAAVAASTFYLLPAVRTTDPARATVVLSYNANPNTLGLVYRTQIRDGALPYVVSRPRR
jgi:hypothetical protein